MRICAVFNVWGDSVLLDHAIKHIYPLVDGVIVVYSMLSNFGEHTHEPINHLPGVDYVRHEPDLNARPVDNERAKRNKGLDKARELSYTHFLSMDADEFYDPTEFKNDKEKFKNENLLGLVSRVKTYFREPTLTIGYDVTLVPTIHKITPSLRFQWNTRYPFAFDGPKKEIRVDPTRQMNIFNGVEMSDTTMHHYSWIRSDVALKVRNSTARNNIESSTIFRDYADAKPRYYCQFYKARLEACENKFNIPALIDVNCSGSIRE